ncbi:NACHT domain-containing protein [Nostoc parmelioides]|uniref:HEAT repeat domain-containing protein n=1 Tax=Nostoc parmelioides FACHB-3921 TaxID=2692909 RepID=A0ABR8BCR0_9NOSO|nr:HEAT repeat domain-containing protein [Nostoc parmelioides]MBD2251877.1 HEAT repeat domain-containing protein [Nostoc parmelioides FACHB-3921]
MTSDEGVALQVDDVYVPLGLVERKKQSKRQDNISPEQGSELYKETEITKTFEHDAFLEEVLKQQNTPKSKGRRIAIIGEPGAGKTTLLQQIANWVFCEIPQSVVIWVSLADLQEQKLEEYLLGTWLTAAVRKKGKSEPTQQQKDDLIALFNQQNVWLLLDGLDEMSAASGNPLTEISRQFRESGFISQARIVLTCRVNLWDGSINALDNFEIYRTLDFSYPQQVEEFISKWFTKIEIPETAKQLYNALKQPGKERIRDLVKNPLRLTLLCLNWQSGEGTLPDTQAGLYQQFVDDFYKWKKEEFPIKSDQRQQLNIKLGELAKEAIDKEATRFRLQENFVTQFLGDADDENSLFKLALKRGWLNQVGIDTNRKPVYTFFHASFQEYFAAKAIDDWHFFLNHVPNNPSQGTYRIFEPKWKQTILLWLGREEENLKQQKQKFIDALVNFKDGCGKWDREGVDKGFYEYQAYFLAAAGISEFRDYSRADEIGAKIAKWGFGYFNTKKQEWIIFANAIENEAKSALQQTDRTKAIKPLEKLLQLKNLPNKSRRNYAAAESLWQIDPKNEQAINALAPFLLSKEAFGIGNEQVISDLMQLGQLKKEFDNTARQKVASTLEQFDANNRQAIDEEIDLLVQYLQSKDLSHLNRIRTVFSLRGIGTGNKKAISALEQLLQSQNADDYTHSLAADSLGKIDPGNEKAIAALVQLLQSPDVDDYMRKLVAESLGTIDPGNEKAIATLVKLLESTNVDDLTRWQAASSLGKIAIGNQEAIAALVKLLHSTTVNDYTRRYAADCLGKILQNNQDRSIVVKVLSNYWKLDGKYYDLAWQCAQNMPYPNFYQAWHQHSFFTRTMRSSKQILFTRII